MRLFDFYLSHGWYGVCEIEFFHIGRVLTRILKTGVKESIPGKVGFKIEKLEFDLEKLEFLVLAEI